MKKFAVTVAVLALGLAACEHQDRRMPSRTIPTIENAVEADINAATNDAANAADNALDSAGNAIENAGNAVENAGDAVETQPTTPPTKLRAPLERLNKGRPHPRAALFYDFVIARSAATRQSSRTRTGLPRSLAMTKSLSCCPPGLAACGDDRPPAPTAEQSDQLNEAEDLLDQEWPPRSKEGPEDRSPGPSDSFGLDVRAVGLP